MPPVFLPKRERDAVAAMEAEAARLRDAIKLLVAPALVGERVLTADEYRAADVMQSQILQLDNDIVRIRENHRKGIERRKVSFGDEVTSTLRRLERHLP